VAIVIPSLGLGGAERVALWLAANLQRCGHRVLLLTQLAPEADVYALPAGLERHVLGPQPWCWGWRPFGKYLGYGASLLPLRVVVTERNAPWRRQLPWELDLLRRLFYRCAAAQVVQTEPIAAWFHRHAHCRRLAVIPNAVQHPQPTLAPGVGQLTPEASIPPGRLLLLAAGTKPHQKGFDLLLEAFVALASRHPHWDLAIVGLDPQRIEAGLSAATLQRRAHAAGLATRVHFVGPVADMGAWYARADCFVLSSRFEGIPNVLLEAMAAGLDALLACPASRAALAARATDVRERFSSGLVLQQWCQALALPPPPADSDLSVPLRTAVTTAPTHRQAEVRAAMPPAEIPAGLGPHRRAP